MKWFKKNIIGFKPEDQPQNPETAEKKWWQRSVKSPLTLTQTLIVLLGIVLISMLMGTMSNNARTAQIDQIQKDIDAAAAANVEAAMNSERRWYRSEDKEKQIAIEKVSAGKTPREVEAVHRVAAHLR